MAYVGKPKLNVPVSRPSVTRSMDRFELAVLVLARLSLTIGKFKLFVLCVIGSFQGDICKRFIGGTFFAQVVAAVRQTAFIR